MNNEHIEGFELISEISVIETIAVNLSIRERDRLKSQFGNFRWKKLKGVAHVRFPNGKIYKAEIHWYEAHGVGRRKMKIKHVLE
ncbi:Genome sequencing data, contig C317 (modular protein) [Desulfamplus magnetovallimortis]|uniref:Genome sequencing data, contig C317 (Modular protein) n=1 Tax=Desulfamplus magnetovallimortis TaxID=1246637 RepID=A0A1W1HD93_9BACT|nr:hypothetical protein [Desulfamplus magnetovallimortis]SLM30372.1 Genome sequencing data, contig C317 (modular protein) [Desulfamplus magnetovallimortis]